ncbi:hypothetical protein L1286_18365 [Pseudoalteromonas sp. SMS1]|uniref:hypothetical protein n=1 Tax=Pseudoalteromonas sp. SMS1 TaxID=2908894 RepID=UPI001F38FA4D|nr:hypothetical protein [Pseudoalteromonas sp. SMS1]MCF2859453.1 hypothetical protein [Pseudoalteromonas sp. SMS1]
MESNSFIEKTRSRGIWNLCALSFFLGLIFYSSDFEGKPINFEQAGLISGLFVTVIITLFFSVVIYIVVVSIRDVIIGGSHGVNFHTDYLEYVESNSWVNKSFKLCFAEIDEVFIENYSDDNIYFIKTKKGQKYYLQNMNDELAQSALMHLTSICKHVKLVKRNN